MAHMRIQYTNGSEDRRALHQLKIPGFLERTNRSMRIQAALLLALLGLAIYASYKADLPYLGAALLSYLFYTIYQLSGVSARPKEASDEPLDYFDLELDDRGLTQTSNEITGFVPWRKVLSFRVIGGRLFIEAARDLWATVPQKGLRPNETFFDEFIAELREHGIEDKTPKKEE